MKWFWKSREKRAPLEFEDAVCFNWALDTNRELQEGLLKLAEQYPHLTEERYTQRLLELFRRAGLELSADELKNYPLDGTRETIPQFKDVLALFEGTGLPLIVEVKSFRDNFAELTERTMAELDRFTVEYCVESFDPRCVAWLRTHRPEVIRGQLSCDFLKDRGNLSLPMAFATTNLLGNIMAQPDFVAYKFEDKKNWAPRLCRKLYGAQGVYWTIRSKEDLETAEREGAIAIFERFIP